MNFNEVENSDYGWSFSLLQKIILSLVMGKIFSRSKLRYICLFSMLSKKNGPILLLPKQMSTFYSHQHFLIHRDQSEKLPHIFEYNASNLYSWIRKRLKQNHGNFPVHLHRRDIFDSSLCKNSLANLDHIFVTILRNNRMPTWELNCPSSPVFFLLTINKFTNLFSMTNQNFHFSIFHIIQNNQMERRYMVIKSFPIEISFMQ